MAKLTGGGDGVWVGSVTCQAPYASWVGEGASEPQARCQQTTAGRNLQKQSLKIGEGFKGLEWGVYTVYLTGQINQAEANFEELEF